MDTGRWHVLQSGRKVEVHKLQPHLAAAGNINNDVYELTTMKSLLRSHSSIIDLSTLSHVEHVSPSTQMSVFVDGKPLSTKSFRKASTRIRSGAGISTIEYDNGSGQHEIRHVIFNGSILSAVDVDGTGKDRLFFARPTGKAAQTDMFKMEEIAKVNGLTSVNEGIRQTSGSCGRGLEHYLEVGIAFDHTLCRFYKYDMEETIMMIQALFVLSSRPFVLDTCVRLALVYVDGYCRESTDPYASYKNLEGIFILLTFIKDWQTPERRAVKRDVMYMVTGTNDGTGVTSGSIPARVGGVCRPKSSFGWVEGINPNAFARSLGQTVGALTSTEGLMRPTYVPGTPVDMFAPNSVTQIAQFLDGHPNSRCVQTEKPVDVLSPIVTVAPLPTVAAVYGSCSFPRRAANVLQCTRNGPIRIGELRSESGGLLEVLSYQEFGKFVTEIVSPDNSSVITNFQGSQEMNGTFPKTLYKFRGQKFNATSRVVLSKESLAMRWPRPFLTCCDHPLYVYVNVKWCRVKGNENSTSGSEGGGVVRRCDKTFQTFQRKVQCESPCFGKNGRVVTMSATNRCATCSTSMETN